MCASAAASAAWTTSPARGQHDDSHIAANTIAASGPAALPSSNPATILYRRVKNFDFDERSAGNYEKAPKDWIRLTGPGLPAYATGQFDDAVGRTAAPSFRLNLEGVNSNVAYEYVSDDVAIAPGSDYELVGYVRCDGLRHSRAFMAAFQVDRHGERIPGSERVSNLARSDLTGSLPWQRLELGFSAESPRAATLRVQLWILQAHTWSDAARDKVDPILLEDVRGAAWFDDITLNRLPRARLRLSDPAGIIRIDGDEAAFEFELSDVAAPGLSADVVVSDENDQTLAKLDLPLPNSNGGVSRVLVPTLPIGRYAARATLRGPEGEMLARQLHFVVAVELPGRSTKQADLGVDFGVWKHGDVDGARELLAELSCRAAKIAVPMVGELRTSDKAEYFDELRDLLRNLTAERVDVCGVLISAGAAHGTSRGPATHELLATDANWTELCGPVLAQFAGALTTWQLGDERLELSTTPGWTIDLVARMRTAIARFVSIPELVIPASALSEPTETQDALSIRLPSDVPARALPAQLAFLAERSRGARWLRIDSPAETGLSRDAWLIELTRRVVLTKVMEPDRLYVPAPFDVGGDENAYTWSPREEFLVLRTLFHFLSGSRAAGVMLLNHDSVGLFFRDSPSANTGFMIVWTWEHNPGDVYADLYLGSGARHINLWGDRSDLPVVAGRARVPIEPMPAIIDGVSVPLALFQSSLRMEPSELEINKSEPKPRLMFRNTFDEPLRGAIEIVPPPNWLVSPASMEFGVERGQEFERALDLTPPPRQVAATHVVKVRVELHTPEAAVLEFDAPLTIGLRDVQIEAYASWDGQNLIVEQSLRNRLDTPVSFTAFCEAPGRARLEREFLNIAGRTSRTQRYLFPSARELAGSRLRTGVEEIRGGRRLDQLVDIPD